VLALDLRYLLTAYGEGDDALDAHHALAHAMSLLHDRALLRAADVRTALDAAGGPLKTSDLDKQIDRVKVTPERLSDEEIFRMWTVFGAQYRLSVAYQASVVLIERRQPARAALPVREARLTSVPLREPVIEDIAPRPVTDGDTLVLSGINLAADVVTVRIADAEVTLTTAQISPGKLTVPLPAGLKAGPSTVQVLQDVALPEPGESRRFFSSNVAAFVLSPKLSAAPPGSVAQGDVLTLSVAPRVGRDQRVALLLGPRSVPRALDPAAPATSATVDFRIPEDLAAGTYLLRISVDGAETPLDLGTPGTPDEGRYVGPTIAVTP
jgi:hypothetical protein